MDYLNSFTNYETQLHKLSGKEFDLSRLAELLGYLGNPHKKLKVIHIAGTKGKGSTSVFVAHILAAAGKKVGLYTSPHLYHVNERIRILDKGALTACDDFYGKITDEQLEHVISILRPHIASIINRGLFLTYFEVLTAAALVFFSEQQLDWVVLETGLGGRLDATNVADSSIAVITPISMDHAQILGNTIEKIAFEKAGIIKNTRQKVVLAPQTPSVMEVLLRRCKEFGITPSCVDALAQDYKIRLVGRHQQINAATAVRTVGLILDPKLPATQEAIVKGLAKARWPVRFELISSNPVIIADGAHNDASMAALSATIEEQYPTCRVIWILGFSKDKSIPTMLASIKELASMVILTKSHHPRAHTFTLQEGGQWFADKTWFLVDSVKEALALARSKVSKDEVIAVTGSLFVAAEARAMLNNSHG